MGRDMIRNEDTVVVRSSIALLQERFRVLQRAKVMRQQKEALTARLSLSETNYYEPHQAATLAHHHHHHHHDLVHGSPTSTSSSPSQLWPALQLHKRKRDEDSEEEYYLHMRMRRRKTMNENYPLLINLWPNIVTVDASSSSSSSVETCSSNKLKNSEYESDYDVDTSLHL